MKIYLLILLLRAVKSLKKYANIRDEKKEEKEIIEFNIFPRGGF